MSHSIDEPPPRSRRAIEACARWLQTCRNIGWGSEDLDFLEALWWEHHDERGELRKPHSVTEGP